MLERVFAQLGLQVLERGWLSSNNIVFTGGSGSPATVVDTGYDTHSAQTLALLEASSRTRSVVRIVNTHLHSDHCGGNAALQATWGCDTWIPAVSLAAVQDWRDDQLTFAATGQRCQQFLASRGLEVGESLRLGGAVWQVLAAPGHDPHAIMLFQPESRVLISGDALWQDRLAIIFPELAGEDGFSEAAAVCTAFGVRRSSTPDVSLAGVPE